MPNVLEEKHMQEALTIAEKIEKLQGKLSALVGRAGLKKAGSKMSPEARERIVAALEARWTASKARRSPPPVPFDPFEAGRKVVAEMQVAGGGAWNGADLEAHYNLTPATLHRRRAEYRIVWWRDAKNQFYYPKWQFNAAGAPLPGIQDVLQTFRSSDEWRVVRYFLAPRRQLDDRSPLDLLRAGEVDTVVAHAKAHGKENSW